MGGSCGTTCSRRLHRSFRLSPRSWAWQALLKERSLQERVALPNSIISTAQYTLAFFCLGCLVARFEFASWQLSTVLLPKYFVVFDRIFVSACQCHEPASSLAIQNVGIRITKSCVCKL